MFNRTSMPLFTDHDLRQLKTKLTQIESASSTTPTSNRARGLFDNPLSRAAGMGFLTQSAPAVINERPEGTLNLTYQRKDGLTSHLYVDANTGDLVARNLAEIEMTPSGIARNKLSKAPLNEQAGIEAWQAYWQLMSKSTA